MKEQLSSFQMMLLNPVNQSHLGSRNYPSVPNKPDTINYGEQNYRIFSFSYSFIQSGLLELNRIQFSVVCFK